MKMIFISFIAFMTLQASANVEDHALNQKLLAAYHQGIATYGKFVEKCDEKKAPILPGNLFDGFKFTEQEMQTVFNYFRSKAYAKCTMKGLNNYLLHATVLKVKTNTEHATKMIAASDELVTYSYVSYVKDEMKYKALSKIVRDKVEKLPELQKLFNAMESYENLSKSY